LLAHTASPALAPAIAKPNPLSCLVLKWPTAGPQSTQNKSPNNCKAHSIGTGLHLERTASRRAKSSKMSSAPAPATWISKTAQDRSSRRLSVNLPEAPARLPHAESFCIHGQRLPPRLCAEQVTAGSFPQGS
jgi:hypothetical protein